MEHNEEMNFDNISFDNDGDDTELNLTDDGDLDLNLRELNDDNDIPVSVAISPKSTEKIAEDIEEVILNLLESGDRNTLLLLTGERPDLSSDLDGNLSDDFASMYAQAVMFNPALKWYSRLTNILPKDQFKVTNGKLEIHIPKEIFNKTILPFLGDFDHRFAESSPLVQLILDCSEKIAQGNLSNKNNINKQLVKKNTEEGLDVGNSGLELYLDTDDVVAAGSEMREDDNDSLNQSGMREIQSSLNLADLSNKAIASYLVEKGLSDEEASEKLCGCISEKARRNEISVLMGMAKKLSSSPLQHLRPVAMRENPEKDDFQWDKDE